MAGNGKGRVPVRRAPFGDLDELRDLLRTGFEMRWPFPLASRLFRGTEGAMLAAVDMFEREGKVIVKAEMPGIEPDKIEVTVADGELRISGEREEEKEVKEENVYRSERSYGRIYRSLTLPEGCDVEHVTASAKDGVIEVTIPKRQAAAKKIEVTSG